MAVAGILWLGGCNKQQGGKLRRLLFRKWPRSTVQPQRIELTTELPGRTSAYLVAEIRPQVNGIIQKRLFTEGSDVKAGQVLYQIDPAPFQAALDNGQGRPGQGRSQPAVDPVEGRALQGIASPTKRSASRTTTTRRPP